MIFLNYLLYLVITLMVVFPFVVITATAVMSAYFKLKSNHTVELAKSYAKAALDAATKMKEKEKENG